MGSVMISCEGGSGKSTSHTSVREENNDVYYLYYRDRVASGIILEQWNTDFSEVVASSEIPWQIPGNPDGGLQSDLADCPVLQTAEDNASFVIRTVHHEPFTGLGPSDEAGGASYLYFYKHATSEFRMLCATGTDSLISNFYYDSRTASVYYELISGNTYSLNLIPLSFPSAISKVIYSGTNEILHIGKAPDSEDVLALIQDKDEITVLRYQPQKDTLTKNRFGNSRADEQQLPVSASDGNCVAYPVKKLNHPVFHYLNILCQNQEKSIILPDELMTSFLLQPGLWLVLGKERLFVIEASGRIRYQVCVPEPTLIATISDEFFIRSTDMSLKFSLNSEIPDTLPPAVHDKLFDLLGLSRGPASLRKI